MSQKFNPVHVSSGALIAARKNRQMHEPVLQKINNALLANYCQVASLTFKPVKPYNTVDYDCTMGYDQAGSSMLVGSIAFPIRNLRTKCNVMGVKIPNHFKTYQNIENFMKVLVNRGGDHFNILQCEMGHFKQKVAAQPLLGAELKNYPYINVSCKGPRMYWIFDNDASYQYTLKVDSDPGNSTHDRELVVFAGKLKPVTRVDTPDKLGLPFGIVIQARIRPRDPAPATTLRPPEFESILEIVLAPNQMAAIKLDWCVPPGFTQNIFTLINGSHEVRMKTIEYHFDPEFVNMFKVMRTIRDKVKDQLAIESLKSDYNVFMKQGDPTLDIIQLSCTHMCEFLWKSIRTQFKIQAYKDILHVMVLDLFRRYKGGSIDGATNKSKILSTKFPIDNASRDSIIKPLIDIYTLYGAEENSKSDTHSKKKDYLFKAVSALLHDTCGLFPFSHGVSKLLSLDQEAELLRDLKIHIMMVDMADEVRILDNKPKTEINDYLTLFKELDESIDFAIEKPCEEYYALKAEMQRVKHWLQNTDIGMQTLLQNEFLDPCSVWRAMFPLKIKPLMIVACLGRLKKTIPWAYDAFIGLMPYIHELCPRGKLPMSIEQLDARTIARRKSMLHLNATAADTAYVALTLELQGRFIGCHGIRQQPKISSICCNPVRIDMSRYGMGGFVNNKGMAENVGESTKTSNVVADVMRQAGRMTREGSVAHDGLGRHREYSIARHDDIGAPNDRYFRPVTFHGFFWMYDVTYNSNYTERTGTKFKEAWNDPNMEHTNVFSYCLILSLKTNKRYNDMLDYFKQNYNVLIQNEVRCSHVTHELQTLLHSAILQMGTEIDEEYQSEFSRWISLFNDFFTYQIAIVHTAARGKINAGNLPAMPVHVIENVSTEMVGDIKDYMGNNDKWVSIPFAAQSFKFIHPISKTDNLAKFYKSIPNVLTKIHQTTASLDSHTLHFLFAKVLSSVDNGRYTALISSMQSNATADNINETLCVIRQVMQFFMELDLKRHEWYQTALLAFRGLLKQNLFDSFYNSIYTSKMSLLRRTLYKFFRYDGMSVPISIAHKEKDTTNTVIQQYRSQLLHELSDDDDTVAALLSIPDDLNLTQYNSAFDAMIMSIDLLQSNTKHHCDICVGMYNKTKNIFRQHTGKRQRDDAEPIFTSRPRFAGDELEVDTSDDAAMESDEAIPIDPASTIYPLPESPIPSENSSAVHMPTSPKFAPPRSRSSSPNARKASGVDKTTPKTPASPSISSGRSRADLVPPKSGYKGSSLYDKKGPDP